MAVKKFEFVCDENLGGIKLIGWEAMTKTTVRLTPEDIALLRARTLGYIRLREVVE